MIESTLRLVVRDPMGSLPTVLAVGLAEQAGVVERVGARPRPSPCAPLFPGPLVDRVQRLPAPGGAGQQLDIESAEPKDWPEAAVIHHDGRFYILAESSTETRHGRTVHLYRLVETTEEMRARNFIPYRPDEARLRRQAIAERDRAERIGVFKPLVGFLPRAVQERYARETGFDALGATRMSTVIEMAIAGGQVVHAVLKLALVPNRRPLAVLAILVWAAFLVEGWFRYRQARTSGVPWGIFLLSWLGSR